MFPLRMKCLWELLNWESVLGNPGHTNANLNGMKNLIGSKSPAVHVRHNLFVDVHVHSSVVNDVFQDHRIGNTHSSDGEILAHRHTRFFGRTFRYHQLKCIDKHIIQVLHPIVVPILFHGFVVASFMFPKLILNIRLCEIFVLFIDFRNRSVIF